MLISFSFFLAQQGLPGKCWLGEVIPGISIYAWLYKNHFWTSTTKHRLIEIKFARERKCLPVNNLLRALSGMSIELKNCFPGSDIQCQTTPSPTMWVHSFHSDGAPTPDAGYPIGKVPSSSCPGSKPHLEPSLCMDTLLSQFGFMIPSCDALPMWRPFILTWVQHSMLGCSYLQTLSQST